VTLLVFLALLDLWALLALPALLACTLVLILWCSSFAGGLSLCVRVGF
jgi:hypothetical protein